MAEAGAQNDVDLQLIVHEINSAFAGSISFVYLPGDNADDGSRSAYEVVRRSLDQLKAPWHAIVGDHDVHEKSFDNFQSFMSAETRYAFTVGRVRFVAMNAFDVPDPKSFAVLPEQVHWVERELGAATEAGLTKVVLLHCYPSDLKTGREEVADLVRKHDVRLVDMGHTHYNEIANDGRTLYTATRSTGQMEEGPVGFSVTNIDNGVVSWRFLELGKLPAIVITSPCDERLRTKFDEPLSGHLKVRAKVWGDAEIVEVEAALGNDSVQLRQSEDRHVWEGVVQRNGKSELRVSAADAMGRRSADSVRLSGAQIRSRFERDQDNAVDAWPEHGILGTQLGPNKNGKSGRWRSKSSCH